MKYAQDVFLPDSLIYCQVLVEISQPLLWEFPYTSCWLIFCKLLKVLECTVIESFSSEMDKEPFLSCLSMKKLLFKPKISSTFESGQLCKMFHMLVYGQWPLEYIYEAIVGSVWVEVVVAHTFREVCTNKGERLVFFQTPSPLGFFRKKLFQCFLPEKLPFCTNTK